MIAIVRYVDSDSSRCTVEVDDGGGYRLVPDVVIGESMPGSICLPRNGQLVEVSSSSGEWTISKYYGAETTRTSQEREILRPGPGDSMFGGFGAGKVGVFDGGIAVCQADETTGIMASKPAQSVNILGKTIAFLNSLYQKTIVESDLKARIDELISGPLINSPRRKKSIDTLDMEEITEYNGFRKITFKIDGDPISPIPILGTEISGELTTFSGLKVTFNIDGVTGLTEYQAGQAHIKLNAVTGEILFNSDGDPRDGVVTGRTICPLTGLPHVGVSTKVKAGIL